MVMRRTARRARRRKHGAATVIQAAWRAAVSRRGRCRASHRSMGVLPSYRGSLLSRSALPFAKSTRRSGSVFANNLLPDYDNATTPCKHEYFLETKQHYVSLFSVPLPRCLLHRCAADAAGRKRKRYASDKPKAKRDSASIRSPIETKTSRGSVCKRKKLRVRKPSFGHPIYRNTDIG